MKTGDFEHTTSALVTLWEILRRDHDFRTFCDRNMIHFRNGFFTEEGHHLPEAEQIQQGFRLVAPIPHYTVRFRASSILEGPLFQQPFLTALVSIAEDEIEHPDGFSVTVLTPLAGDHSIVVQARLSERASLPQITDEIMELARSARVVADFQENGRHRRTRAIEMVCLDAGVVVAVKVNVYATPKQLQRELRRLAGAREKPGRPRRRGARNSLISALRFITPEALRVYDLHMVGLGPREIARRLWPDQCRDTTRTAAELLRLREARAVKLTRKGSPNIERELQRVGEDWLLLRVLEERARKKTLAVNRAISMLDKGVACLVGRWTTAGTEARKLDVYHEEEGAPDGFKNDVD